MEIYLKRSGTMGATTETQSLTGIVIPCTVTLKSSDGSRAIQLSTDGGTEYFTPTYDQTSATMLVVTLAAPASHVKFTGAVGDTWRVQ